MEKWKSCRNSQRNNNILTLTPLQPVAPERGQFFLTYANRQLSTVIEYVITFS